MPRHRYRVTKCLPWIEGGRLGPNLEWIGGKGVVYEPGDTIVLDDREVAASLHCLEPTDDAGRVVFEAAGATVAAPAKRIMIMDIPPMDRARLIRATDEQLRRQGHIQALTVRMLERGEEPPFAELAMAIQEAPDAPIPRVLLDCVAKILRGQPRRPGPKAPARTTLQDLAIKASYEYELQRARDALEANSRRSRAVADVAKRATAKAFRISKRTVERVLARYPSASPLSPA